MTATVNIENGDYFRINAILYGYNVARITPPVTAGSCSMTLRAADSSSASKIAMPKVDSSCEEDSPDQRGLTYSSCIELTA